ncbi:GNAT family N-acetyltransferase [Leifsonia sp. AG29]|uniref:GNAT family N-acetyltransferase n=1 Tax=Leifsonia sp. AG29 TaxID=2598860 RepID=UPI00131A78EF|nr:GNAT family protein [Leifsonia sp. AG29]
MSDEATIPADTVAPHGAENLPYKAQELRTERLLLRPLNSGDLENAHEYERLKDVARYLFWEVHDHDESAEHLRKRIAMNRLAHDGDGIVYAVELPDPEGGHTRVIGHVSLFLKSANWGKFEMGWVFHPAVHGRGYATEATTRILELCFDGLRGHRVFAQLDARNETSARLCEKLGMRQEALLRQTEIFRGEWSDTAVYAILEDEFRSRP